MLTRHFFRRGSCARAPCGKQHVHAVQAGVQTPQLVTLWRRQPFVMAATPGNESSQVGASSTGHNPGHSGVAQFSLHAGSGTASFASPAGMPGLSSSLAAQGSRVQQLQAQLKRYGLAGLLAYGLLNTLYYSSAFLFVWLYVAKVPQGLGIQGAARKFVEVFALTWGGSQLTKIARATGALALAPLVDRLLDNLQAVLRLKSKREAFGVLVGGCVLFAAALFTGVVVVYA